MKFRRFIPSLLTAIVAGTATLATINPAAANPVNTKFSCGTSRGVPATMARTSRGDVAVIQWISTLGDGIYTPKVRCDIVSKRFQEFYDQGTLNFLTTGIKNRLPVICVAHQKGGACKDMLFTLKPGANPGRTLQRLMNVKSRASGPLNESAARVYIDMDNFLQTAPVEVGSAPSTSTPAVVTPAAPVTPKSLTPASSPTVVTPEPGLW